MVNYTSRHASHTAHQTVTEDFIEVSTGSESIRIGFTDQKISGRARLSTFCGFLGWHRFGELLARLLPPRHLRARAGHGGRPPQPSHEIALGFIAGILSGAQRLAHVAFLRKQPYRLYARTAPEPAPAYPPAAHPRRFGLLRRAMADSP
jgi:hypothetical protein